MALKHNVSRTINCDPHFTETGDCNCFRCIRMHEQHAICDDSMAVYDQWCNMVGLDKKQHQLEGIKWCLYHELCDRPNAGVRGGIVADEMGLGKTILMLACIRCNFRPRTLIIMPPALVSQWVGVFQRFFGHTPFVYQGSRAKKVSIENLAQKPIVITTYGMISMRYDKAKNALSNKLHSVRWSRVIYDEAHHVRNMDTARHMGAAAIHADITWMVTGTPINNRMSDLYALCKIAGLADAFTPNLEEIKRLLGIHLLRRTKSQVGIQLPPVRSKIITVNWASQSEFEMAADIHSSMRFTSVTRQNVDQIIAYLKRHPLSNLIRARQMCIYPQLIYKAVKNLKKRGIIPQHVNLADIQTNSKIDAVVKGVMDNAENGRRKLIFSHYRGEIDILAKRIKVAGLTCQTIDGRTKKKERCNAVLPVVSKGQFHSVCKAWNAVPDVLFGLINNFIAPQVMIVQIQTACEGLNMQHFQEIYFTSPHWNPAVEDQAIARAHRIGQDQVVDVYRFIMTGFGRKAISFEQYCQCIQDTKREVMKILN